MGKPCYKGKSCRFISMFCLTASFFLVEIIVGYVVNSIALVADSFHMLSDVVALVVGFASIRVSKIKSSKNTFGWQRAEVLGAMVNAVFLVALCFSIAVESIQRLITTDKVNNPQLMLIVGGAGLLVNLIGLFLFGHGHSHGGEGSHGHSHGEGSHGHSHGGNHDHSHSPAVNGQAIHHGDLSPPATDAEMTNLTADIASQQDDEDELEAGEDNGQLSCVTIMEAKHYEQAVATEKETQKKTKPASSAQLNMRGVFLHVLGDALGSVVVCISALIIWFVEGSWVMYVDPAMSLIMVCIILASTVPLLKESSYILLQSVPQHIKTADVKERILQLSGVIGLHEFHVWQLAGNRVIASTHIKIDSTSLVDYVRISEEIKKVFHDEGIHSVTVQPEFIDHMSKDGRDCALECGPDRDCYRDTCCGPVGSVSLPKENLDEPVQLTAYSVPTTMSQRPDQSDGVV